MECLYVFGVKNIMVENLVFMLCMLFIIFWINGEIVCVKNELFDIEIDLYDVKL